MNFRCHTLNLLSVVLYLGTGCVSSTSDHRSCTVRYRPASPYVSFFDEVPSDLRGCLSLERDSSSRQVHLVDLEYAETGSKLNQLPIVKVDMVIAPSVTSDIVVVFNSHRNVLWIVNLDEKSAKVRIQFLLSRGSKLRKKPKFAGDTIKRELPKAQELQMYVRKKYGALTSSVRVPRASSIRMYISDDLAAPSHCNTSGPVLSHAIAASYFEEVNADTGCIESGPGSREVHVIEVNKVTSGNTISINLRGLGKVRQKYVMLVLRSRQENVTWNIASRSIRGELEIITGPRDRALIDQVDMTSTHHASKRMLSFTTAQLISWARQKYDLLTSYISVASADAVNIRVVSVSKIPLVSPRFVHPSRNGGLMPIAQDLAIAATEKVLRESSRVFCLKDSVLVVVERKKLFELGVKTLDQLSMIDVACGAGANETHYFFVLKFNQCQTKHLTMKQVNFYRNTLIVHKESMQRGLSSSEMPTDIEETGSPVPEISEHQDLSAQAAGNMARFNFMCRYEPGQSEPPELGSNLLLQATGSASLQSRIYDNFLFAGTALSLPLKVSDDQTVFVEVRHKQVPSSTRLTVRSCSLVANSAVESVVLLDNSCVKPAYESSFKWFNHNLDRPNVVRFSFKRLQMLSPWYLKCRLQFCHLFRPTAQYPMCKFKAEYCAAAAVKKQNGGGGGMAHQNVSMTFLVGPFMRNDGQVVHSDHRKLLTNSVSTAAPPTGKCPSIVQIEGLDSGTVVAISFVSFLIGVTLTAALWYIHTRTSASNRSSTFGRSVETSGDSTPCSTAPIAAHK